MKGLSKRKVLIDDRFDNSMTAGGKARLDVRTILSDYESYYCYSKHFSSSLLNYVFAFIRLLFWRVCAWRYKILIIQYPFYTNKHFNNLCFRLFPKRSYLIIHDLPSLRYGENQAVIDYEIKRLNHFRGAIIHSEPMKEWLLANGAKIKLPVLQIFDYILPQTPLSKKEWQNNSIPQIAFAGNLEKSRFVEKIWKRSRNIIDFCFYGIGSGTELLKSESYKGTFPSDVLPFCLEGHFGLVWDGPDIETCAENEGKYLRYNSPHKFSLYMAAGIPVIVWKGSALAGFVQEHDLGVTVNSLTELRTELFAISKERYFEMLENCKEIQHQVVNGHFLKTALVNLLELEHE